MPPTTSYISASPKSPLDNTLLSTAPPSTKTTFLAGAPALKQNSAPVAAKSVKFDLVSYEISFFNRFINSLLAIIIQGAEDDDLDLGFSDDEQSELSHSAPEDD